MLRQIALLLPLCLLAACSDQQNPFARKPFETTPVPADFAIVVNENHLSFVNRQHIQQVITAADGISRITYSSYRDPNGAVTQRFTQETPLTPAQLQAMWDEVAREGLLTGAPYGVNWLSGADLYQENTNVIQIRANGQTRDYRRTNGYPAAVRPLMLLVQGVRLPITQAGTPPVSAPETAPAGIPAGTPGVPSVIAPATQP